MAQLILDSNLPKMEDSDDEMQLEGDDLLNYRGYFHKEPEDIQQKYYEFNAHFPYAYVYKKLEYLVRTMSVERKGVVVTANNTQGIQGIFFIYQDNFRRNANESSNNDRSKERHKQRKGKDKACFVINKNLDIQDKSEFFSEEKDSKNFSKEQSLNQLITLNSCGNLENNNHIFSLINNLKSRNANHNTTLKQGLATAYDAGKKVEANVPVVTNVKANANVNANVELSAKRGCAEGEINGERRNCAGILIKDMNVQNNTIQLRKNQKEDTCKNTNITANPNPTAIFKKLSSASRPKVFVTCNNNNKANISTRIISKTKAIGNPIASILTGYSNKTGRNQHHIHINPQNTRNNRPCQRPNSVVKPNNNDSKSISLSHKVNPVSQREHCKYNLKRLNLEKLMTSISRNEGNRNVTISVDCGNGKQLIDMNNGENININLSHLEKNSSLSPEKMLARDNLRYGQETIEEKKSESKDSKALQNPNQNGNCVISDSLNEMLLSINKQTENKSRNVPRNNLIQTKSNIYCDREKAHSIHSSLYHKNHMLTQTIIPKNLNATTVNEGKKPTERTSKAIVKKNNESKTNRKNMKPAIGINSPSANANVNCNKKIENNVSFKTKINYEVKMSVKPKNGNYSALKKAINMAISNAFTFQQKHVKVTSDKDIEKEKEITSIHCQTTIKKPVPLKNHFQEKSQSNNTNYNTNTNSTIKDSSPNSKKLITQHHYLKVDSSTLKTKSNSITSNVSNSGNTIGKSLIKNYTNCANPTRMTNGSYVTLKKNELNVARTLLGPSDKANYNCLVSPSSKSIEKNSRVGIGMKNTSTEKSLNK